VRRRFGDVEGDEPEVARLQDEPERAQRLLERALVQVAAHSGIADDVPADPEQSIEIDTSGGRRLDIEHVERVDERDELAARRRGGEHLVQQARPPRRARTDELGDLAARKPASEMDV